MLVSEYANKKTRQEWVEWDRREALQLEKVARQMSDTEVTTTAVLEEALTIFTRAYGGVVNLAELMAHDLFSGRLSLRDRLKHHRLMLSLLNAIAKQESAKAHDMQRIKIARALDASSAERLTAMASDNRAMIEAATPIVALAKHGMLKTVLEWCLANEHVTEEDRPDQWGARCPGELP